MSDTKDFTVQVEVKQTVEITINAVDEDSALEKAKEHCRLDYDSFYIMDIWEG